MKAPSLASLSITSLLACFTSFSFAAEPLPADGQVGKSRWSFSAGVSVRQVEADFTLKGSQVPRLDWSKLVRQRSGRGDVGLFRRGGPARYYDDGVVQPFRIGFLNLGPVARGNFVNSSQYSDTGRNYRRKYNIYQTTFHSSDFEYRSYHQNNTAYSTSSETATGPYLNATYHWGEALGFNLNTTIGWSYFQTEHQSANQALASFHVVEHRKDYSYAYDTIRIRDLKLTKKGLGLKGRGGRSRPNRRDNLFVHDADQFNSLLKGRQDSFRDPRKSANSSSRKVASFIAIGRADLDVKVNEIPISLEAGKQFGNFEVLLNAGPTINVIHHDLDAQVDWYKVGSKRSLARKRYNSSGTDVKLGVFGGLITRYHFGERLFVQAHGSYRWVDSHKVQAGFASSKIDLSSWEGGLGLGFVW